MVRGKGFTFIELVIVVTILGIVAFVAIPRYQDYRERARVYQAVSDIGSMHVRLKARMEDTREAPADLSDIGEAGKKDPWGNPYVYRSLATKAAIGGARKNKNLVPINSKYDLYSKGKDGQSASPLTAGISRDDVILANDGGFIGLAKDYD